MWGMGRGLNMEVRNKCIEMGTEFRGLYQVAQRIISEVKYSHPIALSGRNCL